MVSIYPLFVFSLQQVAVLGSHLGLSNLMSHCFCKKKKRRRGDKCWGRDSHFVFLFSRDSRMSRGYVLGKHFCVLTNECITDCVTQIFCEWTKHFILCANKSSVWIRSLAAWQTQSVHQSRLTGFRMSVMSQTWLTVWQGDKTCTAQGMLRQAWKRCVHFISHSVPSSFLFFHSGTCRHEAFHCLFALHVWLT